ncbi:MBL fold metallo-hydrolase [Prescottella equi]
MFEEVLPGLKWMKGRGPDPSVYMIGDVLVDGVPRWSSRHLLRAVEDHDLSANLLTHVHPPTQGAALALQRHRGIEIRCGQRDLNALGSGDFSESLPPHWINRVLTPVLKGPVVSKAVGVHEGETVHGFTIIDAPGHSPGHVALWRESDRTLLVGDIVVSRGMWAGRRHKLQEPPACLTRDPRANRASAKKLARLEPNTVFFAHGEPETNGGRFTDYALSLPD